MPSLVIRCSRLLMLWLASRSLWLQNGGQPLPLRLQWQRRQARLRPQNACTCVDWGCCVVAVLMLLLFAFEDADAIWLCHLSSTRTVLVRGLTLIAHPFTIEHTEQIARCNTQSV